MATEGHTRSTKEELTYWLERVQEDLYGRVLPFHLQHSLDMKNGGYFNCLDEDGRLFDDSKYVWLQGRQVWMFAKLFNDVPESHWTAMLSTHAAARTAVSPSATSRAASTTKTDLLEATASGARFLADHAKREDGHVYFCLSPKGEPRLHQRKMFSGCFYAMGLAEAGRALDDEDMKRDALAMLDAVVLWAKDPSVLGRPSLSGARAHSTLAVPMILLNLFQELELCVPEEARVDFHAEERKWCVAEIVKHVHKDKKIVLENVRPDGSYDASCPEGRVLNPGHAIECGWFLLEYATKCGDEELKALSLDIIRWSFEAGWDTERGDGGILYFMDAEGFSPTQLEKDMKLWWPHCEALIAFAMAFTVTKDRADLDRFAVVAEWTFRHFSDSKHGEWFGYLDRDGNVTHRFKGGPYKGCFHVPRALFMVEKLLTQALSSLGASDE